MKLTGIRLRGVTTYDKTVEVRFDEIGDGLVAVVGTNGSGKTTLLESPFAALYKRLATRPGSLYSYCHGDAFIDASFHDGAHEITVSLLIDAKARKTEGYVRVDGEAVTDGRAATFEAEVLRRFGSAELVLASVFAAQDKTGTFGTLKKGDRKGLFTELLGLAYLDVLKDAARERGSTAATEVDRVRASVESTETAIEWLGDTVSDLAQATHRVALAQIALTDAREDVDTITTALAEARAAAQARESLVDAERIARVGVATAGRELERARERRAKVEADGKRQIEFLGGVDYDATVADAGRRYDDAIARIDRRERELRDRLDTVPDPTVAQRALDQAKRDAATVATAIETRRKAEQDLQATRVQWRAKQNELVAMQRNRDAQRKQLKERAALLDDVPCKAVAEYTESCPLLLDARNAAGLIDGLRQLSDHEVVVDADCSELEGLIEELTRSIEGMDPTQQLADRADDAARRQQDARARIARAAARDEIEQDIAALADERDRAATERDNAVTKAAADRDHAIERTRRIEAETADAINRADAHIAELEWEFRAAQDRHAEATAKLQQADAAPNVTDIEAEARTMRMRVTACEHELNHAQQGEAKAKANHDRADELKQALARDLASVEEYRDDLGEWRLLEIALGRDGVQALEIDAAAPEVTALANELLAVYPGRSFTVRLDTLREKVSKPGEYAEVFDVQVYDGGDQRTIESLSGGEKVVVGEALSLALAILNARKNSVRWRTLWRDETAGALDPEAAQAYVAMLRRARELGGFAQVVFVAHQREVWESADVRVFVRDGAVEIENERVAA